MTPYMDSNPMRGGPGICPGFWDNGVCRGPGRRVMKVICDPTALFSNTATAAWARGQLGQTTELARGRDTVNLGSAVLPTLVLSGAVIGIGWLAWKALRR